MHFGTYTDWTRNKRNNDTITKEKRREHNIGKYSRSHAGISGINFVCNDKSNNFFYNDCVCGKASNKAINNRWNLETINSTLG